MGSGYHIVLCSSNVKDEKRANPVKAITLVDRGKVAVFAKYYSFLASQVGHSSDSMTDSC